MKQANALILWLDDPRFEKRMHNKQTNQHTLIEDGDVDPMEQIRKRALKEKENEISNSDKEQQLKLNR